MEAHEGAAAAVSHKLMKYNLLIIACLFSISTLAQIDSHQLHGSWLAQSITDSKDSIITPVVPLIFDGPSTLKIKRNGSFIMLRPRFNSDTLRIKGTWVLSDSTLIMSSQDEVDSSIVTSVGFGRMRLKRFVFDEFYFSNYIRLK